MHHASCIQFNSIQFNSIQFNPIVSSCACYVSVSTVFTLPLSTLHLPLIQSQMPSPSPRHRNNTRDDQESSAENEEVDDQESETEEMETEGESDEDDDEDFESKRKKSPSKSKAKAKASAKNAKTGKIQIQMNAKKKSLGENRTTPQIQKRGSRTGTGRTPKITQIRTALTNLAKKVLPTDEIKDPSKSLVASLLLCYKMPEAKLDDASSSYFFSCPPTNRTAHLLFIAKDVIAFHNEDPNKAQVKMLNLLFRSVGGTTDTDLDGFENQLEEMSNDEWQSKVTDLVDDMRHTPNDCVLVCSDPDGYVHYNAVKGAMEKAAEESKAVSLSDIKVTNGSLGVREFRRIYEEFWYILGHVALIEGGMGSSTTVPFMDDEIDDSSSASDNDDEGGANFKGKFKSKSKKNSSSPDQRFDTELVRTIMSRIVELVTVGQPDVRAAATSAIMSLAYAILDKTVYLNNKLQIATRQFAATIGGKSKNKTSAKAESLRFQIDSLKRTRAHLEDTIESLVFKATFINRYRDNNMFIRASSIEGLGAMVIRRPDIFLKDKYLKYIGWMLSDKAECVRITALKALNSPFKVLQDAEESGNAKDTGIELSHMENVAIKFMARIADTVIDVHTSVQEAGLALMLSLVRVGFLDDIEDEKVWDQVNLLSFQEKTSPKVRKDALYFIMEQLEEFDDADADAGKSKKRRASTRSDRRVAQRLDAIASWAAHTLTDGDVPIDKIQIKLVDHLVNSLRDMPEHKSIVQNWPAMIRAITDDKIAMTSEGNTAGDRADVAKQRVLVQMLCCSAIAEVESVTDPDFLLSDLDPDESTFLHNHSISYERIGAKSSRRSTSSKGLNHEALSVALLKALPDLLDRFKSDPKILVSLTALPRYFGK